LEEERAQQASIQDGSDGADVSIQCAAPVLGPGVLPAVRVPIWRAMLRRSEAPVLRRKLRGPRL
jgi:hypothetical protein